MHADPLISVVIPVKDEAAYVATLAGEIRQALDGILCRCFTHTRMLAAIRPYDEWARRGVEA